MRFARLLVLAILGALIVAPSAFALRFSDNSLLPPSGVEGQPYFHKLDGAGGCNENDYEFRVVAGTSLPPGLAMRGSSTDWRIEGTPTAAGDFVVALQMWSDGNADCAAEEAGGGRRYAERDITIRIARGLKIEQTQAQIPSATVNQAYGPIQLTASGGGTQSWSALQAPTGITVSSTGLVSGTPTAKSGDSKLVVKVQDGSNRSNQVTYNLPVRDPLAIAPAAQAVPDAEVARPFLMGFSATGGNDATHTWEVSTLPAGLTFDATRHTISGSPTAAGTFPVKVTVKDAEGRVDTEDVTLTIAPKLAITKPILKAGKVGKVYKITFKTRGGVGPVEWRLIRFRPAAGLTFDRSTGTIRFSARVPRRFTIIVRATDSLKARAEQTVTVTIKP